MPRTWPLLSVGCVQALPAAIASVALFAAGVSVAEPAQQATAQARRSAYDAAMKCFVASGYVIGERERAGDAAGAARYEQHARRSFDTALGLGRALSLSGSRIDQDLGLAQTRHLPPMVADRRYLEQSVSMCRALGLM